MDGGQNLKDRRKLHSESGKKFAEETNGAPNPDKEMQKIMCSTLVVYSFYLNVWLNNAVWRYLPPKNCKLKFIPINFEVYSQIFFRSERRKRSVQTALPPPFHEEAILLRNREGVWE